MIDRRVFLLAAGGHGRVVADALLSAGVLVHGVVDPGLAPGTSVLGLPVVGDDQWLDALGVGGLALVNGLGVVPGNQARQQLFLTRKAQGYEFLSVRHPSAVIGQQVGLSEGCQIMAGAVLQCRVLLGQNSVVNTRASIDHDCVLRDHAFVGPGAVLCGGVEVGEAAFLGAGCVLLPGVRVGARAVVGAGAVVTRDVSPGVRVVGNPAVEKQ